MLNDLNANNIDSPCTKKCKLEDNNICQGCFRTDEEIKIWNESPWHIKKAILRNAFNRKFIKLNSKKVINEHALSVKQPKIE